MPLPPAESQRQLATDETKAAALMKPVENPTAAPAPAPAPVSLIAGSAPSASPTLDVTAGLVKHAQLKAAYEVAVAEFNSASAAKTGALAAWRANATALAATQNTIIAAMAEVNEAS